MPEDTLLNESAADAKPKFSAFGWQLNRMEQLFDQAINGYAMIDSNAGRNKMMSSLEMLYVALVPKLTEEDRKQMQSFLIRLRNMIDGLNSSYASLDTASTITIIRKQAWSILEIMNLLKDRKGYGIPTVAKVKWQEDMASALNILPKKDQIQQKVSTDEPVA